MKPLPPTYGKNGFHYEVLLRRGPFAIAQQRLRPGQGCLAFEVFRVKQLKETQMFDRTIEAHEAVPSNEEWGHKGWTYPTLEAAKVKLMALEAAEEAKAAQKETL